MEYREMLHRYVGRRVCVSTFGNAKLWGRVAAVNDDCLRLIDTSFSSDGDDQWLAQHAQHDADSSAAAKFSETVIHFHHIVAITCLDDDLPPLADDDAAELEELESSTNGKARLVRRASSNPIDRLFSDDVFNYLRVERLEIYIGAGLIRLADPKTENGLLDRIVHVRNVIGTQLGFVLPPARLRDDIRNAADEYRICINGSEVARGVARSEKLLAIGDGRSKVIPEGERMYDPLFSQPAVWVDPGQREAAESAGYYLVEPAAVISMQLQHEVTLHAHELFSIEGLRHMIDHLRYTSPTIVEELLPQRISLARLHDLLSRLLEEGVPLRPLDRILEHVAHLPPNQENIDEMLAALRLTLGRVLCDRFRDRSGRLPLVTFDRVVSARLLETLSRTGDAANSIWLAGLIDGLQSWYRSERAQGRNLPLVVDTGLRRRLRQYVAHQIPGLSVLAFAEIPHELPVQLAASLGFDELGLAPARKPRRAKAAMAGTTTAATSSVERPAASKRRVPR